MAKRLLVFFVFNLHARCVDKYSHFIYFFSFSFFRMNCGVRGTTTDTLRGSVETVLSVSELQGKLVYKSHRRWTNMCQPSTITSLASAEDAPWLC